MSWIPALAWAKQLLGTCSFIAVYVEYYCTIFDHATCFVLVCFPELRKAVQQVQENVFTTESFSELELHPHLVSGRKAVCLETCFGLGGGQVRELRDAPLLMVTWTESPGLCLILLESRSSACGTVARPLPKHAVPAPITVCGYNTKKTQETNWGCSILTSLYLMIPPAMFQVWLTKKYFEDLRPFTSSCPGPVM